MSTVVLNVAAQTYSGSPVTISLSGLIKPDATVEVKAGNATAYKQNVTFMPPLDFTGQAVVECEASDGNKVVITIGVVPKPSGLAPEAKPVRVQTRITTMPGDPVEERFWEVTSDSGKLEGPAAAYVPLKITKVTALGFEEGHEPEQTITDWNVGDHYFQAIGAGSWIQYDLGQVCDVSEISIAWKSQGNFQLAISVDRKNLVKVYEGRGVGISKITLFKVQAVIIKIISQADIMEIYHVDVKGAPITPKPTQTGAQAVLQRSSQIIEPGQLVIMDGSQSRGDIVRYVWDQSSTPTVSIFNANTSIASFVAPEVERPTTLQFSLTIVDRNGQYSKAESLIHVKVDYPGPHWKDGHNPGCSGIAIPPDIKNLKLRDIN